MRYSIILLLIFSIAFMFGGCKKDEEISDLEQEVLESDAADNLTDSIAEESAVTAEEELAMTPEKTPEETPSRPEMPIRMETAGFCVQVSASTSYENTYNLVELYAERGYEAYVTEAVIEGETFYRVRIGVFETVEQARQLALELSDKYSANYWIAVN